MRFERRGKLCVGLGDKKRERKKRKKENQQTVGLKGQRERRTERERERERESEDAYLVLGEVVCTRVERKINFPRVSNEFDANRSRTIFSTHPFPDRCFCRWFRVARTNGRSRNFQTEPSSQRSLLDETREVNEKRKREEKGFHLVDSHEEFRRY